MFDSFLGKADVLFSCLRLFSASNNLFPPSLRSNWTLQPFCTQRPWVQGCAGCGDLDTTLSDAQSWWAMRGGGGYRSRFTDNKTAFSQFTKNIILAFHASRKIKNDILENHGSRLLWKLWFKRKKIAISHFTGSTKGWSQITKIPFTTLILGPSLFRNYCSRYWQFATELCRALWIDFLEKSRFQVKVIMMKIKYVKKKNQGQWMLRKTQVLWRKAETRRESISPGVEKTFEFNENKQEMINIWENVNCEVGY